MRFFSASGSMLLLLLLSTCLFGGSGEGSPTGMSTEPAPEIAGLFDETWARTDLPVEAGQAARTWMWGPEPFTDALAEVYVDAPVGQRRVQYYDKSRMEITDPNADPEAVWFVTNGLLVVELMTGRLQAGDGRMLDGMPANIAVAGDPGQPDAPTYASLAGLLDAAPHAEGATITARIGGDASPADDPELAGYGVAAGELVAETNHRVASPFWDFLHSTGTVWTGTEYAELALFSDPFFATGLPITEAYWTTVAVAGEQRDVLLQCFERRCLTYTPGNPEGWQVESGNVGRHYYEWRYEGATQAAPVPYLESLDELPVVTVEGGAGAGSALVVEVVDDQMGRQCGLMHRLRMPENQAMLFVFESDQSGGFWNCNTFIPLTLAWIDVEGVIVDLTDMDAATPGQPQTPMTYTPSGLYRYVIEANQGWFAERGVAIGDPLDLDAALSAGATSPTVICNQLGLACQ